MPQLIELSLASVRRMCLSGARSEQPSVVALVNWSGVLPSLLASRRRISETRMDNASRLGDPASKISSAVRADRALRWATSPWGWDNTRRQMCRDAASGLSSSSLGQALGVAFRDSPFPTYGVSGRTTCDQSKALWLTTRPWAWAERALSRRS